MAAMEACRVEVRTNAEHLSPEDEEANMMVTQTSTVAPSQIHGVDVARFDQTLRPLVTGTVGSAQYSFMRFDVHGDPSAV